MTSSLKSRAVKAKDSPKKVFEALVNYDDLKPPARHTILPPPHAFA
jgi:hypothetical protein